MLSIGLTTIPIPYDSDDFELGILQLGNGMIGMIGNEKAADLRDGKLMELDKRWLYAWSSELLLLAIAPEPSLSSPEKFVIQSQISASRPFPKLQILRYHPSLAVGALEQLTNRKRLASSLIKTNRARKSSDLGAATSFHPSPPACMGA